MQKLQAVSNAVYLEYSEKQWCPFENAVYATDLGESESLFYTWSIF